MIGPKNDDVFIAEPYEERQRGRCEKGSDDIECASPHVWDIHIVFSNWSMHAENHSYRWKGTGSRHSGFINLITKPFFYIRRKWRELGGRSFLLRTAGILVVILGVYLLYLRLTIPDVNDPGSLRADQSSIIVDRSGTELYRLFESEDRTDVEGNAISPLIRQATIAIEDERFFDHGCIEIRSIVRSIVARILGWNVTGGASTLTQQLARNALLTRDRTLSRKLREIMLACQLEGQFDKEKLLELYLNRIPFGNNAYGIEQASQRYFGVRARDLTLAQAAVLASIPQRPSYFSPYGQHVHTSVSPTIIEQIANGSITSVDEIPDHQIIIGLLGANVGTGSSTVYIGGRSDQVLANMLKLKYIQQKDHDQALTALKTMNFQPSRESIRAPYFVLWIKEQVEQLLEGTAESGLVEQGGLVIETTLDWELQKHAEKVVTDQKNTIAKNFGAQNIALVAIHPQTREVLAYVGNSDFKEDSDGKKVDMANSPRSPGSSFKPFVYAAAFQEGYGPATVLYDVPTKFGPDQPSNYDGTFWGLTTVRKALGGSRNIPAIKAYFLAGEEDRITALTSAMGVTAPRNRLEELRKTNQSIGWPLALGAAETPLLEMVNGYAVFANNGESKPIVSIRRITQKIAGKERLLYQDESEKEREEVLDPRIAYQITSILSDVSARPGEFWQNALSVPGTAAAAKTGTSNKACPADARRTGACRIKPDNVWTLGYTPEIVAGVWVGNANSSVLSDRADGLNVAAPLWKEFLRGAIRIRKPVKTAFDVPRGIVQPQVSLLSGELPTECTPVEWRKSDVFLAEHAPGSADPACTQVLVDKATGLLASASCPIDTQEQRSFFVPQVEIKNRPALEVQWREGILAWAGAAAASGSGLPLPLPPLEACNIQDTPGRLIQPTLDILYPQNGGTATHPAFQPRISYITGSTAKEVTFKIDGRLVARETVPPFRTALRVPRTISEEGSHTLEVTLTDSFYNTVTQSVSFTFGDDHAGPTVRLLSPLAGSAYKGGMDMLLRADAESEGGIKYVEFYVDDVLLTRLTREPFRANFPLVSTLPGMHRFRAVATDLGGKTAEDSVEILVEPALP